MTVLDIGSGYPTDGYIHLQGENILHFDIRLKAYHLDVQGDAHKLPFKDGVFTTVYAGHVLEHIENPSQMLREIKRVLKPGSRSKAIIKVPNACFFKWKTSGTDHISSWGEYEFNTLLCRIFTEVTIMPTLRNVGSRPRRLLNFMLRLFYGCNEITAVCRLS